MVQQIDELDLRARVTLIRTDLDVPLNSKLQVLDDARIQACLPTIQYAFEQDARVILAGQRGTFKKNIHKDDSMEPVGQHLAQLLDRTVILADDCAGDGVVKNIKDLREGEVLLVENLAYYQAEKKGDSEFARALIEGVDVYINEDFARSHQNYASVAISPQFVPRRAVGYSVKTHLDKLGAFIHLPSQPYVALVAGDRFVRSLNFIRGLIPYLSTVLVAGEIAYTFLQAKGISVGASRVDHKGVEYAAQLLKSAAARGVQILLPTDYIVREQVSEETSVKRGIPDGFSGISIGPQTQQMYLEKLVEAKTMIWFGGLGDTEDQAAQDIAKGMIQEVSKNRGTQSLLVGAQAIRLADRWGVTKRFGHSVLAEEAAVALLSGKKLPGISALEPKV